MDMQQSNPLVMNNRIRVFLVGEGLKSLTYYKKQIIKSGTGNLSFCLNGTIALNHFEEEPEVIILNCGQHDLFGLHTLRKIKKLNPKTQVIIAVSPEQIKIGRHALRHGAFAYIIKGDREFQQIKNVMELICTLKKPMVKAGTSLIDRLRIFMILQKRLFFPGKYGLNSTN